MKQREKRNIIIGILCCMVVFMSVGYAVLSQTLKINGTANITGSWNIYIDSITFNESESSSTTSGTGSVDQTDKTKATYSAELLKPQDVVVYDVVVANGGTIDAVLNDLVIDPTDTEYFTFETIGIAKGDELPAQTGDSPTTRSFKIKITFKDSVTEANMPPAGTQVEGLVKLDYVQKTTTNFGTESVPGGGDIDIEEEKESDFLVTSDGMLLSYRGTNPDVVVPAEVNGVRITKIAPYAFNKSDFVLLAFADGSQKAVITNDAQAETIREVGAQVGIEEYPREDVYTKLTSSDLKMTDDNAFIPHIIGNSGLITEVDDNHEFHHVTSLDLSQMLYLEEIGYGAISGYVGNSDECPNQESGCGLGTLTSLKLPMDGALTTIGAGAFASNQLTTIEFPESLITIENGAFNANNLTGNITIPENIANLGRYAFQDNNLTSATILGDKTRFDSVWDESIYGEDAIFDAGVIRLPE